MMRRGRLLQLLFAVSASAVFLSGCGTSIDVLNPKGPVAKSELNLIYWSIAIMTIVLIAVFAIFGYVLVKYRANRPGGVKDYAPEQEGNRKLETVWTFIPIIMVILLAIPTVRETYRLASPPDAKNPITIDVTSANWKWIFKYPDQGIETVNYVKIPAGRPVNFQLTAVGPMNSFWVPQLGGQEYNMPGMDMTLWLEAAKPGHFTGRSANFSGEGFTHMSFDVEAKSESDFESWVNQVKSTAPKLSDAEFQSLLKPGTVGTMQFSSVDNYTPEMTKMTESGMQSMSSGTSQAKDPSAGQTNGKGGM